MALKKSELYSSLWSSCDELRGGMDASQYKDYVLVLLFIKYVSDKYAGQPFAPITIPPGASFKDMVALKGKSDIGDQINKKIIAPLANANKLSDMPDFNDANKLGSGKEMVDRLTNLIAIFENKALDFSRNRADGDDILGDAYESLMRHFATESGKSKGQFYTSEVSRIIAQVLGICGAETSAVTTVYDPTCGSGSLLLQDQPLNLHLRRLGDCIDTAPPPGPACTPQDLASELAIVHLECEAVKEELHRAYVQEALYKTGNLQGNRYQSTDRREACKLDTQARYESWQKEYRKLKMKNPTKSDKWCSLQIKKLEIAQGRDAETIRKHMKK